MTKEQEIKKLFEEVFRAASTYDNSAELWATAIHEYLEEHKARTFLFRGTEGWRWFTDLVHDYRIIKDEE